jgi:hypothetical protein
VQPATDPVATLHHNALNPTVGQRVRDRQSGDPRTDHHHPLDRPHHLAGNVRSSVIETLSSQPGPPPSVNCQVPIQGRRNLGWLAGRDRHLIAAVRSQWFLSA